MTWALVERVLADTLNAAAWNLQHLVGLVNIDDDDDDKDRRPTTRKRVEKEGNAMFAAFC